MSRPTLAQVWADCYAAALADYAAVLAGNYAVTQNAYVGSA